MSGAEEVCRSRLLDAPARVRSLQTACSALGVLSRIGSGCMLLQTTYKHPALGLGEVLLDAFGTTFQVRELTKIMFQDATNVVLAIPPELILHNVPAKYSLSREPVDGNVIVEGDEVPMQVVGFGAGGFVIECRDYLETRIKPKFMVRGGMRDHLIDGDYVFERMDANAMTCGVAIKAGDRIQHALWQSTIRDLAA